MGVAGEDTGIPSRERIDFPTGHRSRSQSNSVVLCIKNPYFAPELKVLKLELSTSPMAKFQLLPVRDCTWGLSSGASGRTASRQMCRSGTASDKT